MHDKEEDRRGSFERSRDRREGRDVDIDDEEEEKDIIVAPGGREKTCGCAIIDRSRRRNQVE